MRRGMMRRLARVGAERLSGEAIGAAFATLDRGEQPEEGEAAELVRYMRAFLLFGAAQTIGAGELTDEVLADIGHDITIHTADLERAQQMLEDWYAKYGDKYGDGIRGDDRADPVGRGGTD